MNNKKFTTFLAIMAAISVSTKAQVKMISAGGGEYKFEKSICVSPAERQRIQSMLESNIQMLKAQNILPQDWGTPKPGAKPTAGTFIWPLRQATGYNYNSYYGISNYVDLDPINPGYLLDWNCGERTYDLSGYNHSGIDIFTWPFAQIMQENGQVEIVAAANGIIIGKDNGNFDKNCSMSGAGNWNAVYVGNDDGTICWYGHMKNNSLTLKGVGLSVTAGEYLGTVGSSGQSTGPHLHFETHAVNNEILEPFEGPCNNHPSLWASQKPYIEPTINAVFTHTEMPEFTPCPQLEKTNRSDTFLLGSIIYFAAYFHDQTDENPVTYTILRPDKSVFSLWDHTSNSPHYAASYWAWYNTIESATSVMGEWIFKASYEGHTVEHKFYVTDKITNINEANDNTTAVQIFPNPNDGKFSLNIASNVKFPFTYTLTDISGKMVQQGMILTESTELDFSKSLISGMYFINVTTGDGQRFNSKIIIN